LRGEREKKKWQWGYPNPSPTLPEKGSCFLSPPRKGEGPLCLNAAEYRKERKNCLTQAFPSRAYLQEKKSALAQTSRRSAREGEKKRAKVVEYDGRDEQSSSIRQRREKRSVRTRKKDVGQPIKGELGNWARGYREAEKGASFI